MFEGVVLGNAGVEYGLVLYLARGGRARLARHLQDGRLDEARRVEALAVTLADQPAFAVEALQAAFDLPRVPIAMRVAARTRPVTEPELVALAAALRAVAKLTPLVREATAEAGGEELRALAQALAPGARDARGS